MQTKRSKKFFRGALNKIPGGVNSPVRAWKAVGGQPLFILRGKGSSVFDADGNRYIDFVGSWGPLILGHAPAKIVQTIKQQAKRGFTFGAPTAAEVRLAESVSKHVPSIQKLRLVNSGTEATMSALRLAPAFARRATTSKDFCCF